MRKQIIIIRETEHLQKSVTYIFLEAYSNLKALKDNE